ncbi:MAG: protein kinase [Chitinivibrionales bacterium]|nr:protein kinase [Chitinivibrionales bacterium]
MSKEHPIDKFDWMPERIGHYKILGMLGMGGMGAIYKAEQEPLNRIVAMKVLLPVTSKSEESMMRFEIEAKAISMLQHQNIINIYEYGIENTYRYFAMQYVDGKNLAQRIAERKSMPYSDIIDISKQICRALRYAHEKNVIHRDIKPQNVLIDKSGTVLLSDFGIAKIFTHNTITMTGVAVGTPEYMSPEQAEGKTPDVQTDIYSLGIVMYEMVTGLPPFTGDNAVAIAYKQVHELPPPPSAKRKDIPKRLELIILKALKKDKKERYHSITEMLEHLDSVDIDEKIERPTLSISGFKVKAKSYHKGDTVVDKRITDRRSGDRRRHRSTMWGVPWWAVPFHTEFWIETWNNQWLSLVLIGALAMLFLLHILSGH